MPKKIRAFMAPAGLDPAALPPRVEIDPDEFWEMEEGEPIALLFPRPEVPGEFTAVMAVFSSIVAGFYRDDWGQGDPRHEHWAVFPAQEVEE